MASTSGRPAGYVPIKSISSVIQDTIKVDVSSIPGIFIADDADFAVTDTSAANMRLDAKVGTMKTYSGDQKVTELLQGNVNYMWAVTFGVQTSWQPGTDFTKVASVQYSNWWSAKIVDNDNWIHFTCENKGTSATNGQRSDNGATSFLD